MLGRRKASVFVERQALLEPVGIPRSCPDGGGAYERHVEVERHPIGTAPTQKIESKPINRRTRLKRWGRRTICFAKTVPRHDWVLGLFIKRYAFGVSV